MKHLIWASFIVLFASCSDFQKVLKSNDFELKLTRAKEYYEKDDYYRALSLYEELVPQSRGTGRAEEIYYYYSYCHYYQNDYILGAYHFKKFTMNFPNSKKVEECLFMAAMCHYKNSPPYSLDQTDTKKAIKELELFVNNFTQSERIDSCNALIDKLRGKLEKKEFEIAKLYFKTQNYRAAAESFSTFVTEFPDSDRAEESRYLAIQARYNLAKNSIPKKKLERINDTYEAYTAFVDLHPNSKWLKSAEKIYETLKRDQEQEELSRCKYLYKSKRYMEAASCYEKFIDKFPGSDRIPDCQLEVLVCKYDYAMERNAEKKLERITDAIKACAKFAESFPEHIWIDTINRLHEKAIKARDKELSKQS